MAKPKLKQLPSNLDSPSLLVKICFEEVDTEEEGVKGCRVYLETSGRPITEKVLIGADRTIAEAWAAEIFDFVHYQLTQKMEANMGDLYTQPKREDMN